MAMASRRKADRGERGERGERGGGFKNKDREIDLSERRARFSEGVKEIDFRDIGLLRRFVTQQGKIMPARMTGATAKKQREISRAVRRARVLGLLP